MICGYREKITLYSIVWSPEQIQENKQYYFCWWSSCRRC